MTLQDLKRKSFEHIARADFDGLFELLRNRLNPSASVFNQLVHLSGRYNRTQHEATMKGTLSREQAVLEFNQISDALLQLARQLEEKDLGSGGALDDPLDQLARDIPVDFPLTPLYLVNCDRKKPVRSFWRCFDTCQEFDRRIQFYFIPACPTQEPESFSERIIYELLEKELDSDHKALDFPRQSDDRLRIAPLPMGATLEQCKKAFKKYFGERFPLSGDFEEYLRTGLPKYPFRYVASVFKLTAGDWDEDLLPPYLQWIMDSFRNTGPEVPVFLFFFVVLVKNAHQPEALRRDDREVLRDLQKLVEAQPRLNAEGEDTDASLITQLPPVPADDLENWLEHLGNVSTDQKLAILEHLSKTLTPAEKAAFDTEDRLLNMERIEVFQEKVYQQHKHL